MFSLLLVLACQCRRDPEPERVTPDPYLPPDLPGPWAPGYGGVEAADGSGSMPLWFPAVEAGSVSADYAPLGAGEASTDARPDCEEARPVVVFSHASGGLPLQSWYLAERLSTHGYISVAPLHAGNNRDDNDLTALAASVLARPGELSDAFDALVAEASVEGSALSGCVDADAGYAVVGHDLGATSALMAAGLTLEGDALSADCEDGDSQSCQVLALGLGEDTGGSLSLADARVWAAVAMAPSRLAVDGGGMERVARPTAIFGGVQDTSVDWETVITPLIDGLGADPLGLGTFDGAGHASFTTLCPLYPQWPECAGAPYRSPDEVHALIDVTAVPFLEFTRGEDRAEHYLPPDYEGVAWMWARGG